MMAKNSILLFLSLLFFFSSSSFCQKIDNDNLRLLVNNFKADIRGPYKDIRWFCKDGTTVAPQERCAEIGGVQRARYKPEVIALGKSNHIYLGQILSTTDYKDFWDAAHDHSRLEQFQLELFLRANDDGWINRRAQYYRGAFQVEDEEAWGIAFYKWLLTDEASLKKNFFFIRQSAKDIPHNAENNLSQQVRALSKEISDLQPSFMDLRVKIHGQPEPSDIQRVRDYQTRKSSSLSASINTKLNELIDKMDLLYAPIKAEDFKGFINKLPSGSEAECVVTDFIGEYNTLPSSASRCALIANTTMSLRTEMEGTYKANAKLALLDVSIKLEVILMREAALWQVSTLKEAMEKVYCLAQASASFGYLERWEWELLRKKINVDAPREISLSKFSEYSEEAAKCVEWGTGMVRGTYADVVKLYSGFEPLANGFIDDKVRGSVLLALGNAVSLLGDRFSKEAGFSNAVMGITSQSSIRGLNPGYAMGELVVTDLNPEDVEVFANKIYVFDRPPADLKPVAGIATVTEGNMVSHVQLLARNLGIPNAVLSMNNLKDLMKYNGKQVFFAVSNKGTVILKSASEMTQIEKDLFSKKIRSEEKISVPIELMELKNTDVLDMRNVDATASGIRCGPKAANLGQLKKMYPDHVVEGLVIPFSIFRAHFEQQMPGTAISYWAYLKETFAKGDEMRSANQSELDIENFILDRLSTLRAAIKKIKFDPAFKNQMEESFTCVFGQEIGQVPVFLRSDTNMEDLKDFTGAGLNLTLFNVLDAEKIWEGIKDVWASPYTERSYRWRQRYLLNPENVFPSILIIPSVNADYSGVMITKGVSSGKDEDVTVAFNRGVGGAVEGQASESWLLASNGENRLISPAREPEYTSIPATGGTVKVFTTFHDRLLSENRLRDLRSMAEALRKDLKALGMKGPYDVELGFKNDKIWLFQVRPFVENKKASASQYLGSITPKIDGSKLISLDKKI
jgi:hypothetical protein